MRASFDALGPAFPNMASSYLLIWASSRSPALLPAGEGSCMQRHLRRRHMSSQRASAWPGSTITARPANYCEATRARSLTRLKAPSEG